MLRDSKDAEGGEAVIVRLRPRQTLGLYAQAAVRARSIRARVTEVMPSRSATVMCSWEVWISAMPLQRFRHGLPAALNTFASAPPPDSMNAGVYPQRSSAATAMATGGSSPPKR